jgi:hypothetical protein
LRSHIQHWSIIKNSAKNVSDEQTTDAFFRGLHRYDFIEEMGRTNLKKVSKFMDIANKFADGEDAYNNKRTRSPEDDHSHRYSNQRQRSHNYDGYSGHNQVAASFSNNNNQGDEHHNGGHYSDNRDESGPIRPYRLRTSRDYNQSPEDILNRPCNMHYTFINEKRVSNHLMKDYRTCWLKASRGAKSRVCRNPRVSSIQRTAASFIANQWSRANPG